MTNSLEYFAKPLTMGQGGKLTIKSYFMSESYYFTLDDGIYRWKQFVGAIHENKFDSCNSYLFSAADLGYINKWQCQVRK